MAKINMCFTKKLPCFTFSLFGGIDRYFGHGYFCRKIFLVLILNLKKNEKGNYFN